MSYATLSDMLARFERERDPELSHLTGDSLGVRQDAQIVTALSEASGEMDTYIGSRYTVPLTGLSATLAADLARVCCDIARYRLWDAAASDEVRVRYEDALRLLRDIAAGRIALAPTAAAGVGAAAASYTSAERVMSRATLSGLI